MGTASEETVKCGGYQLALDHPDAAAVVCAEPTSCRIAIGATGSLALRLDAYGRGAHSSVPGGDGNAIVGAQAAARAVVDQLSEIVSVPHLGPRRRAVNVGVIRGGVAQPVVPRECTVWLDVRYFVGESVDALMARIERICSAAVADLPGISVRVSQERLDYQGNPYPRGSWGDFVHVERGMRPFVTDPTASIVRVFQDTVKARGGNADVEMMPGWGDIEFVATDHGVPALYFGPGDLAAAHTADEYLDLDRYHEAIPSLRECDSDVPHAEVTDTCRHMNESRLRPRDHCSASRAVQYLRGLQRPMMPAKADSILSCGCATQCGREIVRRDSARVGGCV